MSEQANMATIQLNGDKQNFIIDKKTSKPAAEDTMELARWLPAAKNTKSAFK